MISQYGIELAQLNLLEMAKRSNAEEFVGSDRLQVNLPRYLHCAALRYYPSPGHKIKKAPE
jgi:hypothetical protein